MNTILPLEFLNALTPNGLPQHKLQLKKGAIVMLLRNLNINAGLCNGTRLVIIEMKDFSILAQIISGSKAGSTVILPRINLSPSVEEIPFTMTRRQFPVRLAHAMTINKAQGQSFKKVGVYLPSSVFSHGQLYVALSRASNKKFLKVLISGNEIFKEEKLCRKNNKITNKNYTKNIVFHEVL